MRILLTSNASYAPARGGSTRSNLAWLRHLAAAGHPCSVVCAGSDDGTVQNDGIEINSVRDLPRRASVLGQYVRAFQPDWVLVSSEDLSHVLLREAFQAAGDHLIYLAHTPQFFPFGPESWNADDKATSMLRGARAVVAIGRHMAQYIQQHAGVMARVIHPPIYGRPPWPAFDSFGDGSVLMINPCRVKGVGIFAAVAQRLPEVQFSALIGWGTTSADQRLLATLPNVRLLGSVPDINDVLSQTSVLLMPSIWYEGFGLIAMEAMLRGVPVIASDSGGLKEAKAGTGFVVPVHPVKGYRREFDETHMPMPIEPEQNIEPWVEALRVLLTDREVYLEEVLRSREHAIEFVSKLRAADFEDMLSSLSPSNSAPSPATSVAEQRLTQLSPAQRALLLKRLKPGVG